MLRVFLLLCLTTHGNLTFKIKRILLTSTKTLPSVTTNKTDSDLDKAIVNSTILVKYINSASGHGVPKKHFNQRIRQTRGNTKGNQDQESVKKKLNVVIKSIIPFTEAPSSLQFLDEKTESSTKMEKNYFVTNKYNIESKTGNKRRSKTVHRKRTKSKLTTISPLHGRQNFIYNPQIYEPIHDTSEPETDKDNLYNEDIIPVRLQSDSLGGNQFTYLSSKYATNVDNPIFGDQAFISFILNDYFDRNVEDDPKLLEDVRWGKDFDGEAPSKRDAKRIRRLENNYIGDYNVELPKMNNEQKAIKEKEQINLNFLKAKSNVNHTENYREFKDFVETFALKFGSNTENYDKLSKNKRGNLQEINDTSTDSKDDFIEASELFDELIANFNNDRKMVEPDSFMTTISDFEQFLNAQETQSTIKEGDDFSKNPANNLSRLRHVAKNAALVNNADYIDTLEYIYRK